MQPKLTTSAGTSGVALTRRALLRWSAALPAASYDVRLVPEESEDGPVLMRRWSAAQLLAATPWLRRQNRYGYHVYARPASSRFLLVDDLDADSLGLLRSAHKPSAIVQTSPGSLQVWLRVSEAEVPPDVASAAARLLAARVGGDPGAANARQVGRLAGFCNRKLIHLRANGTFPFALLLEAAPRLDPGGAALLREAAAVLTASREETAARPPSLTPGAATCRLRPVSPAAEYTAARTRLVASLPAGTVLDRSRLDYAVAARLLRRGAAAEWVESVLQCGERAAGLPLRARLDYVHRTVAAAARAVTPLQDA